MKLKIRSKEKVSVNLVLDNEESVSFDSVLQYLQDGDYVLIPTFNPDKCVHTDITVIRYLLSGNCRVKCINCGLEFTQ